MAPLPHAVQAPAPRPGASAPPPALTVSVQAAGDRNVLGVVGEIDLSTTPHLVAATRGLLAEGHHRLVLDLEAVTFMDASALGFLVATQQEVTAVGGTLELRSHEPTVLRLMALTGLSRMLTPHPGTAGATPLSIS